MVTFSMTRADLKQAAKTSWKWSKILSAASRRRGNYRTGYTPSGLLLLCIHSYDTTKSFFRYCIPMDNNRPSLELRHFKDICPDKNGMLRRSSVDWD